MDTEFSKRLANLRKQHGYSQEQLGDMLYVSRQAVSKWECGDAVPDIDNLTALAKLYDVSLDELIEGGAPTEAKAPTEKTSAFPPRVRAYSIASAVLILAPLIFLFIRLPFLPDTIPAHYDIGGNVDRYGSKFELLLLITASPAIAVTLFICGFSVRKNPVVQAQKQKLALILFVTGAVAYIGFFSMTVVFTEKAANLVGTQTPDMYALVSVVGACLIMLFGAVVPFTEPNPVIGIRTAATLGDPVVWRKTNIAAGIAMLVSGGGLNVMNLLYQNGIYNIIAFVAVTVAVCAFCVVLPAILTARRRDND